MKKSNKFVISAAIGLAAFAANAMANDMSPASDSGKEKCYGVAKAGKNDCGSKLGGHSCAGQAKENASKGEFLLVPSGLCERLAGGSTEEPKN